MVAASNEQLPDAWRHSHKLCLTVPAVHHGGQPFHRGSRRHGEHEQHTVSPWAGSSRHVTGWHWSRAGLLAAYRRLAPTSAATSCCCTRQRTTPAASQPVFPLSAAGTTPPLCAAACDWATRSWWTACCMCVFLCPFAGALLSSCMLWSLHAAVAMKQVDSPLPCH